MELDVEGIARVNRTRVYEDVIRALERLIENNGLGPGDKLPSESELSERLNVGTRSIREAYTTLRTLGVVEIKHGKGIFLSENTLDCFLESLAVSLKFAFSDTRTLLLELTYVRTLIETGLVHDFAMNRSQDDIDRLRKILDEMEADLLKGNLEDFNRTDLAFHTYIVMSSENRIIDSLYRHLQRLLSQSIEVTQYYGGREERCLADHKKMFALIVDRKADEAQQVMSAHLACTRKTIESLRVEDL